MHTTTTRTPIEMGSDEDDGFEGLLDEAASVDEPFPGSGPRPGLFLCLLMSTGTTRRKRRGHSYRYRYSFNTPQDRLLPLPSMSRSLTKESSSNETRDPVAHGDRGKAHGGA